MSDQNLDRQSIVELRAMARVYMRLGRSDDAAAVLKLATEIEKRIGQTGKERSFIERNPT